MKDKNSLFVATTCFLALNFKFDAMKFDEDSTEYRKEQKDLEFLSLNTASAMSH